VSVNDRQAFTTHHLLLIELIWIKKVEELSKGNAALIAWKNN